MNILNTISRSLRTTASLKGSGHAQETFKVYQNKCRSWTPRRKSVTWKSGHLSNWAPAWVCFASGNVYPLHNILLWTERKIFLQYVRCIKHRIFIFIQKVTRLKIQDIYGVIWGSGVHTKCAGLFSYKMCNAFSHFFFRFSASGRNVKNHIALISHYFYSNTIWRLPGAKSKHWAHLLPHSWLDMEWEETSSQSSVDAIAKQ